jgi:hypothetical protein
VPVVQKFWSLNLQEPQGPVQACSGKARKLFLYRLLGIQKVEASRVFQNWHIKVARLSALRIGIPRENLWYSFLLEAESNLGSYCGRRNEVNEKSQ